MKLCTVCGNPFQYPPSDNKADATTCAWCTTPLTDRAEQNTSGEPKPNTLPANVERSPLPAQESAFFEARIRTQAENIINTVVPPFVPPCGTADPFPPQSARYELRELITKALLAAHSATSPAPDASKEYVRGLEDAVACVKRLQRENEKMRTEISPVDKLSIERYSHFMVEDEVIIRALISQHSPQNQETK